MLRTKGMYLGVSRVGMINTISITNSCYQHPRSSSSIDPSLSVETFDSYLKDMGMRKHLVE